MTLTPDQARRFLDAAKVQPSEPPMAQSPFAEILPVTIGEYVAERLIGAGGMGAVYEASQPSLGRAVALKVVHPYPLSPRALERFRFEAVVLSRLRHPNIATIYDAGTAHIAGLAGEWPYYAMELIPDAQPIHTYADDHDLPIHARLGLLIDVCGAVHHAHQRGVIHRDLKPDNILVGADGSPKVIDFGIAGSIQGGSDTSLAQTFGTQAGALLGSPQFMAPEQYDSADVDVRADVYALGMILYLLLTDDLPYDVSAAPLSGIAARLRTTPIAPPSSRLHAEAGPIRRSHLEGNLDSITLKALEPNPGRRYQSAAELGQDLNAHLRGDPIMARAPSAWQRAARWAGRHPFATTLALCIAMLATAAATTALGLWLYLLQPSTLEFDRATQRVAVVSRGGTDVSVLQPTAEWHVTRAVRVGRRGDWVVVVAEFSQQLQRPRLRALPARDLSDTLWTVDLGEPGLLTPPHPSFAEPMPEDRWGVMECLAVDVFAGDAGQEEVVLFISHTPSFPGCIAVLDSASGDLLHIAWHTGHIRAVAWVPEERLFIAAASCNRLPWSTLGSPLAHAANHPVVVFAYRPTRELWTDRWLASPSGEPHSTLWYAACIDPEAGHRLYRVRFDAIGSHPVSSFPCQFSMGFGDDRDGRFNGITWRLGPHGPQNEAPRAGSAFRALDEFTPTERTRLVLLDGFQPLGHRDPAVEMNGQP